MTILKIGKLQFRNPVITASGTFGMGDLYRDFLDYSKIGGITLKTVTKTPRKGNPPPRILETTGGLLNSIGLENSGFKKTLYDLADNDTLKDLDTNVIFSLAGNEPADFAEMVKAFSLIKGIAMFELNLSCPNVHEGGATFDSDKTTVKKVIAGVSKALLKSKKPFTVKLSPAQDFILNSKIAEEAGANAVTISNTFVGMAIDLKTKSFYFKNKTAGYSGPAVKPIALNNVYRAAKSVKIPVIASGGISSVNDAKEFLFAGAKFVSIGTMNFVEPGIAAEIASQIG